MENRGKMKYRTCFSSVSFHGYKLDLLKSGLQKYLRRREYEKMVWCALEIWRFEEGASTDIEKKMCKGIISNLLNRIIVMMDEEMIFNECARYIVLRKLIEKFESDRKKGELLVKMCYLLVNSKMIRRNSDIRGFWNYRFKNEIVEEKEDKFYFEMFKKCFEEKNKNVADQTSDSLGASCCSKGFNRAPELFHATYAESHLTHAGTDFPRERC